jgi:hypothetical protein
MARSSEIHSSSFPARAGLTALDRKNVENLDSLLQEGPVGNSASRVVLRSAGHSELPQPPWRRRRRAMEVGKARVWRK